MEIRPVTAKDIEGLIDIDGTIESTMYLHLDQQSADAPRAIGWRLEERTTRQKHVDANRLSDEVQFAVKQIASGADEGVATLAEHDDTPVALLVARRNHERNTLDLLDLRIDYEHRRQGVGTAMMYQLIGTARDIEVRAVHIETTTSNFVAAEMLRKLGFELSGVDTRRRSNHDVVKESATLFWYLPLGD